MTTAYLAGPMRGIDNYNFPEFERVAKILREYAYSVVSPAEIDIAECYVTVDRDLFGKITHVELTELFDMQAAMRRDFRELLRCDIVVLLPGWEQSIGASAERRIAMETGIPVFAFQEDEGAFFLVPVAALNPSGEVRITDPATGGTKGQKLARTDLIPADALLLLAEHFGRGAEKYADRNWEKGYQWSLSYGALLRHLLAFWSGEDTDAETGSPHIVAVVWHAMALTAFQVRGLGTDNRPCTVTP